MDLDWSKAKSILIVIFVILNLFLAGVIIKLANDEGISQDTIENAKKALLNRGVIVNSEIPLYNKKIGTLVYGDESINKKRIVKNFLGQEEYIKEELTEDLEEGSKENLKEDLEESAKEKNMSQEIIEKDGKEIIFKDNDNFIYKNKNLSYIISADKSSGEVLDSLKKLFKGTGVPINQFVFDKMENGDTYIFRQKYNEFWIFENYISVLMSKEDVLQLECRYRKIDGIEQGSDILTAHQVLIKNHDSIKDIEIVAIDLGFKEIAVQNGARETTDDIPVWRIRTSGDEELFYRVYDGEKINTQ